MNAQRLMVKVLTSRLHSVSAGEEVDSVQLQHDLHVTQSQALGPALQAATASVFCV